jgi:hypothetical protein
MICPNWDDLYPPYGNRIWYLYEPDSHRFVIEWDSVHYFSPNTLWDKFEVIVFDTTVPTPTGDNRIVFQYYSANNYTSNTVGIEDHNSTRGICCVYNGSYHRASAPLIPGRAIAFETGEPQIGIAEFPLSEKGFGRPNIPTILFGTELKSLLFAPKGKVTLYDITGKAIARPKIGEYSSWRLPAGIYFLRFGEGQKGEDSYKVIVVR